MSVWDVIGCMALLYLGWLLLLHVVRQIGRAWRDDL